MTTLNKYDEGDEDMCDVVTDSSTVDTTSQELTMANSNSSASSGVLSSNNNNG